MIQILDATIHSPAWGKNVVEYSRHARIREASTPVDWIGVLREEFEIRRGQIMVSGKFPRHPSPIDKTDSLYKFA